MADFKLETTVDVEAGLGEFITNNFQTALAAQLSRMKLPPQAIKQELGVDLDLSFTEKDRQKIVSAFNKQLADIDKQLDQARRQHDSITDGRKKGEKNRLQDEIAGLATARSAVEDAIKFVTQDVGNFNEAGKLIKSILSGSRRQSSLTPAEVTSIQEAFQAVNALAGQVKAFANSMAKLKGKVALPALSKNTSDAVDSLGGTIERVPVVLEQLGVLANKLARPVTALSARAKAIEKDAIALEAQLANQEALNNSVSRFRGDASRQRAVIGSLSDPARDAARRDIDNRIRQLQELQSKEGLSAGEDREYVELQRAADMVAELRRQSSQLSKQQFTEPERQAEQRRREEEARARQEQRENDERARKAQASAQAAADAEAKALRLSEAALARANVPLESLSPAERASLAASLRSSAGSLRRAGEGRVNEDPIVAERLRKLDAALGQLQSFADKEKAAKAAQFARDEAVRAKAAIGAAGPLGELSADQVRGLRRDTGDAIKALNDARKQLVALGQDATETKKALQELEGQQAALNKRSRELASAESAAAQAAAKETNAIRNEIARVGGLGNIGDVGEGYRTALPAYLKGQMKDLRGQVDAARASGDKAAEAEATKNLNEHADALKRVTGAARENMGVMGQLGTVFQTFFKYALGYGALYQVINAFSALTRGIVDFQARMAEIKAVAGLTVDQMDSVAVSIGKVADKYAFSVNEIQDAALTLAQAGVDVKDIGKTLDSVAGFAAATGSNLKSAADLITSLKDVYENLEPDKLSALLTQAVNISKLTGSDLQTIIGLSAGVAKSFNLSAEQYLAAVSTLRNAGLRASTVATGLRQAMLEIFNPQDKLLKALQQRYKAIGEDQSQQAVANRFFGFSQSGNGLTQALNELERLGIMGSGRQQLEGAFDIRSRNALEALLRNRSTLAGFEGALGAGDSTSISAAETLNTVAGAMQHLRNEAQLLANELTESALPGLTGLINTIADLLKGLRELDENLKGSGGHGVGQNLLYTAIPMGLQAAFARQGGVAARAGAFLSRGGLALGAGLGTEALASEAGASGPWAETLGTIASLVLPGLLGKLGTAIKARRAAGAAEGAAGIVESAAPSLLEGSIARVLPWLGRLGLAIEGLSGPIGWILGAITLLGFGSTFRGASAQQTFEAANRRITSQAQDYATTKAQADAYGTEGSGPGKQAAVLATRSKDLSDGITQYFGTNAKTVKDVSDLLRQVYAQGLDATGKIRQDLLQEIKGKAVTPISEEAINQLAQTRSEIDAQTQAIFDGILNNYERIKELGDKASAEDQRKKQAFDALYDSAYRYVITNPGAASGESRLAAIQYFNEQVKKLADEAAAKQKEQAEASLKKAREAFDQALAEDPDRAVSNAKAIAESVRLLGGDVVAAIQEEIEKVRKELANRQKGKAVASFYTAGASDKEAEKYEQSLGLLEATANKEKSNRDTSNKAIRDNFYSNIAALEDQTKKLNALGGEVPKEATALLQSMQAGKGYAYNPESKVASDTSLEEYERVQKQLAEAIDLQTRKNEGRAITSRVDATVRSNIARSEKLEEAKKQFEKKYSYQDIAQSLGISPDDLQAMGPEERLDAIRDAYKNTNTAVDAIAEQSIAILKTQEATAKAKWDKLKGDRNDGKAIDEEQIQQASKAYQDLQAQIRKAQAQVKADKLAASDKALQLNAQALKDLADASLAVIKSRVDDAVTFGTLTVEKLADFKKQADVELAKLELAFKGNLYRDPALFNRQTNDFTEEGQRRLNAFRATNRNPYEGTSGAAVIIQSAQNQYANRVRDIDMRTPGYTDAERQHTIATVGHEYAEDEYRILQQQIEAKGNQRDILSDALGKQIAELTALDQSTAEGQQRAKNLSLAIDALNKEYDATTKDMNALVEKAKSVSGSLTEQFKEIGETLSPKAMRDRADRAIGGLSAGIRDGITNEINGIADALYNATQKAHGFSDTMKQVTKEVGASIAQMFLRAGVQQFFSAIWTAGANLFGVPTSAPTGSFNFSSITGGLPTSMQVPNFTGNRKGWADISVDKFAGGGLIVGPGNDQSDSIPGYVVDDRGIPRRGIRVANGESILTGQATRLLGKKTIDLLNRGQNPLQAQVQQLSSTQVNNRIAGDTNLAMTVNVQAGEGGTEDTLNQPQFMRAMRSGVLRIIEQEKRPGGSLYKR